jgi:hypothetical protein
VVEQDVRRAGALDALVGSDDPGRGHRGLERVGLEPLAEEVVGRHRHELDEDCLLALGQLLERSQQSREREQRARVERGRVGRDDGQDRLDEPGHVNHEGPVFLVRLGVHLRPAPELANRPAVVVDPPQVVARADRVAVAVLRRRPAHALGDRRERAVERQDVEAVAGQLELADDLRPEQRHDVRQDRETETREDLLGDRRAPEHVPLLQHDRLQPRTREIGGTDQAVVAAADHDRVVALGHANLQRGTHRERPDSSGRRCLVSRRASSESVALTRVLWYV